MSYTVVYSHVYDYFLMSDGSYRPILDVQLFYSKGRTWVGRALLDSGADYPTFDVEIAGLLGIDLSKLPTQTMRGIGAAKAYRQTLGLKFGPLDKPVECKVYFIEGLKKLGMPHVIGRIGGFDQVLVGFDERLRKIYMALNDK